MKKKIMTLCLSIIVIGISVECVHADSVNISYYFEGLDLDLGKEEIDQTVLFLMMGETLEEILRPDIEHLNDFKPPVDLSFDFAPVEDGILNFVLQNDVKIAMVEEQSFDEIDGTILDRLEFTDEPLSVPVDNETVLIAWTKDDRAFKMTFFEQPDLSVDVNYVKIYDGNIPEPATFGLLGLGIAGILLLVKRKKKLLIIILLFSGISFGMSEIANAQTGSITVIKEDSTGDGTIIFGEQKCEPGCKELTIPYTDNVGVLLKAVPDSESRFVRWKTPEKRIIEGRFDVQPGDTIIALFQNKYELFTDDPYIEGTPFESDPSFIRTRYVQLFPDVLENEGQAIFNVFDNVYLKANVQDVQKNSQAQYVWIGFIPESQWSNVVIAVYNGSIVGNIFANDKMYGIRPAGNKTYAVVEIDQTAFPPCDFSSIPVTMEPIQMVSTDSKTSSFFNTVIRSVLSLFTANVAHAQTTNPRIDIMVVYTEEAVRGAGGSENDIRAAINQAIAQTNGDYARSGINQTLNLVHTRQVNYNQGNNTIPTIVTQLQDENDQVIDEVHRWRDEFGADVVCLWIENRDTNGTNGRVAEIMGIVEHAFENRAFGVVVRGDALNWRVFAHELAHIMSARHEWGRDSTNNSPYTYNHAYVNPGNWGTIMMATSNNQRRREGFFSNPNITHLGETIGVAEGQPNAEDNARTLNETATTVAGFRDRAFGGVNLKEYCTDHGYATVHLGNRSDPGSWKCEKRDSLSVDQACKKQYRSDAWAHATNWNNAHSWGCYVTEGEKKLGGVDLWGHCQRHGYDGAYLVDDNPNAGNWKCAKGMSVNQACAEQYGNGAWADTKDWNNPFSWQCYNNSGKLGGVELWDHCQRHGYDGAYLIGDNPNAGSWKCGKGMSVNNACAEQYGDGAWADTKDWNNPLSWQCYKKDSRKLGGVDLYGYCRNIGYDDVYRGNSTDAGSWRCLKREDIDVTQACREQKNNSNAYANAYDPGSAYSWGCYVKEW